MAGKSLFDDPFIGYDSLSDACNDCEYNSQAEVLARMLLRQNLFISGVAGAGKGFLIKRFAEIIKTYYNDQFNVALTSSTGLSATLIDGTTIHSWSKLRMFNEVFTPQTFAEYWSYGSSSILSPKYFDNILFCDTLIVDEVSMLPAYFIDNLDALCKYVRNNDEPFGGIHVIFVGDFMQLPPVIKKDQLKNEDLNTGLAITSTAWKNANIKHLYLDKSYRSTDKNLQYLLDSILNETVDTDPQAQDLLAQCMQRSSVHTHTYTQLFTKNINVDAYNNKCLEQETGQLQIYPCRKTMGDDKSFVALKRQHNIPDALKLKVGATVMVTKNIFSNMDLAVANGSIGKVLSLSDHCAVVQLNGGKIVEIFYTHVSNVKKTTVVNPDSNTKKVEYIVVSSLSFMPLKLAYATTIHKSQGQTFDGVKVDLSQCFTPGLGYVAISRATNLDSLAISKIDNTAFKLPSNAVQIVKRLKKTAKKHKSVALKNVKLLESILSNPIMLDMYWDVDESGTSRFADYKG